jgi:hypothetical protein
MARRLLHDFCTIFPGLHLLRPPRLPCFSSMPPCKIQILRRDFTRFHDESVVHAEFLSTINTHTLSGSPEIYAGAVIEI